MFRRQELLTIFASDNATSSKAAFKIFLRCSVKAAVNLLPNIRAFQSKIFGRSRFS